MWNSMMVDADPILVATRSRTRLVSDGRSFSDRFVSDGRSFSIDGRFGKLAYESMA